MHVTYGFVYYYCVIMLAMTASLAAFVIRPLRKKVCGFFKRVKLMDHFLFQSIVYISFAVIFVILIDAVWTYYSLKKNLDTGASNLRDFALDNFELVKAQKREDYLQLYRNYREFYMSERNFMLTSSALFLTFVFRRLCATISKINDLESEIEDGKLQPCSGQHENETLIMQERKQKAA